MPNGGSDCCGECGFFTSDHRRGGWCSIRNLYTIKPMGTYCANQTHRNLREFPIPLGPVWISDPRHGSDDSRVIWQPVAADAKQIELELAFLDGDPPPRQWPVDQVGVRFDAQVIEQISERRDGQALPGLVELLCKGRVGDGSLLTAAIEQLAPYATLEQLQAAIAVAAAALPSAPSLDRKVGAVVAYLENLAKYTEGHITAANARRPSDT